MPIDRIAPSMRPASHARCSVRGLLLLPLVAGAVGASPAAGQSLLERTPNITGNWVGVPGTLHFNFLHRFTSGGEPARKVVSSPTFLIAVGLPRHTLLGVNYATNSDVAPSYPNEWEPFVRWSPRARPDGALDLGLQAGYNVAAQSADAEASLGGRIGAVRLRAAARYLSNAYDLGDARAVLALGTVLRIGQYVALSGDYAAMLERPAGFDNAWSGAVQLAIPHSPHTLSLHVTNANTATLQGASAARGDQRRYGFEFTIPVTLRRYFGSPSPSLPSAEDTLRALPPPSPSAPATVAAGDTLIDAAMRQFTFDPGRITVEPGTTIEWTNTDPLAHTVTADDSSWTSGIIEPGQVWRRRFDRPGTYTFHCMPHPFMKGTVIVRSRP